MAIKLRKKGVELVKRGRRTFGGIYTLSDTRLAYLAYRWNDEIYRDMEPTISEAMAKKVAGWAIDEDTLIQMRARNIQLVGVLVKDTGDHYITSLGNFFDPSKSKLVDWSRRGGSAQRSLPLQHFGVLQGYTKIR